MNTDQQTIEEILYVHDQEIAEKVVEIQYKLQPAFWKPYGSKGRKLSVRDAGYHLPFLGEAVLANDPKIFTDYVQWVKMLFRGLNFPDNVMITTLKCTGEVLQTYLDSEKQALLMTFIQAGLDQMEEPVIDHPGMIPENSEYYELASEYIAALLIGDKNKASKLIMQAVEDGVPIKDIYIHVFQASQYEVGRLWLMNKISVAQEHYCSAATQLIMSQLYPKIFDSERNGKRLVAACIGGELHEIGIRMVSDFFEMEGWDTYYLGANSPASTIIGAAKENGADLLALSIAMPYHGRLLRETIAEIRKDPALENVKILIGGNAIIKRKGDFKSFGADGYAPDAIQAIKTGKELIFARA